MAAAALLKRKKNPTDKEIDEAMTNICRCGTYQRIREALHVAVKLMAGAKMSKSAEVSSSADQLQA